MSAKATASVYNFNDDLDLSMDINANDSISMTTDMAITNLQKRSSKEIVSDDLADVNDRICAVPPLDAAFLDQLTSPDVKLGRAPSDSSIDRITSELNSGWGIERNINKINDNFVGRGAKSYINTRSGVSLDRLDEGDYYNGTNTELNFNNSLNSNMGRDNNGRGYRSNSNGSNNYSVDTEIYRMGIAEDRPRNDSVYSIDQESIRGDREFEKEARQKAAEKASSSPRPHTTTSRSHAHGGEQNLLILWII